jgi:hypothetical protein
MGVSLQTITTKYKYRDDAWNTQKKIKPEGAVASFLRTAPARLTLAARGAVFSLPAGAAARRVGPLFFCESRSAWSRSS